MASIINYLMVLNFETRLEEFLEVFQDVADSSDLEDWAKEFAGIGKRTEPKGETVAEQFFNLSIEVMEAVETASKSLGISDRTQKLLKGFYRFKYRAYWLEFQLESDIEDYNEDLKNCLDDWRASKFSPYTDLGDISDRYLKELQLPLWYDLKDHKMGFMDKLKFSWFFVTGYDGAGSASDLEEFQKQNPYGVFMEKQTVQQLFDLFAGWYFDLIVFDMGTDISYYDLFIDCILGSVNNG